MLGLADVFPRESTATEAAARVKVKLPARYILLLPPAKTGDAFVTPHCVSNGAAAPLVPCGSWGRWHGEASLAVGIAARCEHAMRAAAGRGSAPFAGRRRARPNRRCERGRS